jgi:hypothetical protein
MLDDKTCLVEIHVWGEIGACCSDAQDAQDIINHNYTRQRLN